MNHTFSPTKSPSDCTGACNQGRACTCKPGAEMACHAPEDEPPTRGEQAAVALMMVASAALVIALGSAMLGWLWRKAWPLLAGLF